MSFWNRGTLISRLVAIFLVLVPCHFLGANDPPKAERPHILFINLDDADRDMLSPAILAERFPAMDALAKRGLSFTNFHVTSPRCGPSRSCLLRGQYSHSIGMRVTSATNWKGRGFSGDYQGFVDQGYVDDEMGMWMKDAGYHTVFVGKYHNVINGKLARVIPKGWNEFYSSLGSRYYDVFRYTNRKHAEGEMEVTPTGEYRTNVEADDLVRIINTHESDSQPMFIYFAPFGPHTEGNAPGGMIDVDEDADRWLDIEKEKFADFDEEDFSDKPPAYNELRRLNEHLVELLDDIYRKRMLSLLAVDRAIGRIVQALEDSGKLENTYIFLTSDNGFNLGEHRMAGKGNSMTRSANVPLIVCGPDITPATKANHLLGHIDLAPTFLNLAGAESKPFFDGKSFLPLLQAAADFDEPSWREAILIENWDATYNFNDILFTTYTQLRRYDSVYTNWSDGSREYYDLDLDPLELENAYDLLDSSQQVALETQLKSLRRPILEPLATVEHPNLRETYITNPSITLKGVAEASSGVDEVTLVIRKGSTGEFWDGSEWQRQRTTVSASLKNQNGVLSDWSYTFEPPESNAGLERYFVYPRAYSKTFHYTRNLALRILKVDSSDPQSVIERSRSHSANQIRVIGTARDNDSVAYLRIHLYNPATKEYFDGSNWVSKNSTIEIEPKKDGRWNFITPALNRGTYVVRARAYDQAGNYDATPAIHRFSLN